MEIDYIISLFLFEYEISSYANVNKYLTIPNMKDVGITRLIFYVIRETIPLAQINYKDNVSH